MSGPVGPSPAAPGTPDTAAPAPDVPWQRLDPRMLLVHPVVEVVRFLPALIGVFVVGGSVGGEVRGDGPAWWQVGSVAVPVLLGLLRYLTTRFRVTPTRVQLRRGLLRRAVLSARLDRVRALELTATPVHRVLGLARLEIGVGSTTSEDSGFVLDGLPRRDATTLRALLLSRGRDAEDAPATTEAGTPAPPPEEVLLRLDPTWARYAPLTTSGAVVVLGLLGAAGQLGDRVGRALLRGLDPERLLGAASVPVLLLAALLLLLVVGSVVAVVGYLVANAGLVLTRDRAAASVHSRRGLLTRTETSLDEQRLRGLEVGEPLGLRLAGAARLAAVSTGLDRKAATGGQLVPPAPRRVVEATGAAVLGDPAALRLALVGHGPLARRRRWLRALTGAALVPTLLAVGALALGLPWWPAALGLLALPVGALLAEDRARRLGHGLTAQHLVVRSGSLRGRRDVLARAGIIGWNLRQTWFQRRVGLATLVATTAAGRQRYVAHDVPLDLAVGLARAATPELLEPFLVPVEVPVGGAVVEVGPTPGA